jgi:hypothetical protein
MMMGAPDPGVPRPVPKIKTKASRIIHKISILKPSELDNILPPSY